MANALDAIDEKTGLKVNRSILDSFSSYSVVINTKVAENPRGRHSSKNETITMFTKKYDGSETFESTEDFEKTLMHEILHAYTSKII